MARRSRGEALNPWPGYVDALSTLLMVIIFVLLVFVLAQGFLSVTLSSRDRALERLNRQVSELAEMLALERGQTESLRGQLTRADTRLREALTARDTLAAALEGTREAQSRDQAAREAAEAEVARLGARLSDMGLTARGDAQRLSGLEAALAEALTRAEAATGDAAVQLRRFNETNRALAEARGQAETQTRDTAQALAAEREARARLEAERTALARQLAEARAEAAARAGAEAQGRDRGAALARQLAEAEAAVNAERAARAALERQSAEATGALLAERQARAALERQLREGSAALTAEREARGRAEAGGAALSRQLTETRGQAETARLELANLRRQLTETAAALALAERQQAALREELRQLDQTVQADRATVALRLAELARATAEIERLNALREQALREIRAEQARRGAAEEQAAAEAARRGAAEARAAEQAALRSSAQSETAEQTRLSEAARARIALLTRQLTDLREQLTRLANALDAADDRERDSEAQITTLRGQLNLALAARVEELTRYRSDFFGRVRQVLGDRPEVRIVGDRFVFQSEVLFPPGSAELSVAGERQLRQLTRVLVEISGRIPPEIAWVLRVDGHADRTPIRTPRFASNWELSAARAIAVANLLIQEGLPANRVAAAAFGDNQPLDTTDTPEALARNRRIELRLTDR